MSKHEKRIAKLEAQIEELIAITTRVAYLAEQIETQEGALNQAIQTGNTNLNDILRAVRDVEKNIFAKLDPISRDLRAYRLRLEAIEARHVESE